MIEHCPPILIPDQQETARCLPDRPRQSFGVEPVHHESEDRKIEDRVRDPHPDPRKVAKAARTFKLAVAPGLNQFRNDLLERWPEIRYIEVMHEDDNGQRTAGNVRFVEDGREAVDGEFTHVMVRLKAPELEIVDTLIAAGIANNRAEAIRWALTRIRERPAYEQLREHTRDIDRLKSEF